MMSTTEDTSAGQDRLSPPLIPPESPGSSVSSRLQDEYSELLKHVAIGATSGLEADAMGAHLPGMDGPNGVADESAHAPDSQAVNVNTNHSSSSSTWEGSEVTPTAERHIHTGYTPKENVSQVTSATTSITSISEPVVTDMGYKLDGWLARLKKDIMDELGQVSVEMLTTQLKQQDEAMRELVSEKQRLEREVNRLGELVSTCEQSLARKDTLLDNLTQALARQRDKTTAAGCFFRWRLEHLDLEREKFTDKLATLHHKRQLSLHVFKAWFGQVQTKWRVRVERQCQEQAQAVCRQLSSDYEAKISSLNHTVDQLDQKVKLLQQERENYAESVKKAFMRGVCALNMEAMSAFSPEDASAAMGGTTSDDTYFESHPLSSWPSDTQSSSQGLKENLSSNHPPKYSHSGKSVAWDSLPASDFTTDHQQTQSLPAFTTSGLHTQQAASQVKGRVRKDKAKSKSAASSQHTASLVTSSLPYSLSSQGQSLAPPMASVIVERHQPVTKQTLGRATASKYPKHSSGPDHRKAAHGGSNRPHSATSGGSNRPVGSTRPHSSAPSSQTFKPLAGQTTHTQSIKVVD